MKKSIILSFIAGLALLMMPALTVAQTTSQKTGPFIHMPSFYELEEGWNTMKPGGETRCAHGTEYEFYTRAADPEKLLVFLYGGGACWDAEGCREGSNIYSSEINSERHPSRLGGILDPDHPENPFGEFSMVAIPVCTGDVHIGNNDATYTLVNNDGEEIEYTIHHRGLTNALSAINWITSSIDSPEIIFVAGSSAGSLGVPFHANQLATYFQNARVAGLGDDASSYGSGTVGDADPSRWGFPDKIRQYPGWELYGTHLGITDLYITGGSGINNLRLFQLDHANDFVQHFYLERSGNENPDVFKLIQASQESIRNELPGFRSFINGGHHHTALVSSGRFYNYRANGQRLRDWVAAIAKGEDVPDVQCEDCKRPGFIYNEDDLAILNTMIDRLSNAWNPTDEGGACPGDAESWSLRCALIDAVGELSDLSPGDYSIAWDLLNEVMIRINYQWGQGSALILYNNMSGMTAGAIIELLEEVWERIRVQTDETLQGFQSLVGCSDNQTGENLEQYLTGLYSELMETYILHHKTDLYAKHTTEDYLLVVEIGLIEDRELVITTVENLDFTSVIIENEEFLHHGDTVVLIGQKEMNGNIMGYTIDAKMRYMAVFVQEEGRWKMLSGSFSPVVHPSVLYGEPEEG